MLTVVGLGLIDGDITFNAVKAIKTADKVFIKTTQTDTYNFFKQNNIDVISLDYIYESSESFTDLNTNIINVLVEESKNNNVVFCVNGNGADDSTVIELKKVVDTKIISGVGHLDNGLKLCPDTSFSQYSAYDCVNALAFYPDKRHTLIIKEIDSKLLASEIKLILQNIYGDEHTVFVITDNKVVKIALIELDHKNYYNYSTTCIIPPVTILNSTRYDIVDLIEIMEHLIGDNGCPWDKAQTHLSIRSNLIEEAYELIDAIDNDDIDGIIEETGDVLLQAVFHSMIGKSSGEFNFTDALTVLCTKLIFRHTHIFGVNKAKNEEEALKAWDNAKNIEKSYSMLYEKMEKVPKNLPALLYAYKIQKIAVKCGFDWKDINGTYDKLYEEIVELQSAQGEDIFKEAGDVLFSAINPLRWLKVEPELALKGACDKFIKRFKYMESKINETGEDISDYKTREKYWAESKKYYN